MHDVVKILCSPSVEQFGVDVERLSHNIERPTKKSPKKQKSPVPNERDEAYARGSTLLPSD